MSTMNCKCPACEREIAPATLAGWITEVIGRTVYVCEGEMPDGKPCHRILGARAAIRPCPKCGHNNWRLTNPAEKETDQ
jgi:hypothetical protein